MRRTLPPARALRQHPCRRANDGMNKDDGAQTMRRLGLRWDLGVRALARNEWREIVSGEHLRADVVAGVTVACVAIPLSLAM